MYIVNVLHDHGPVGVVGSDVLHHLVPRQGPVAPVVGVAHHPHAGRLVVLAVGDGDVGGPRPGDVGVLVRRRIGRGGGGRAGGGISLTRADFILNDSPYEPYSRGRSK